MGAAAVREHVTLYRYQGQKGLVPKLKVTLFPPDRMRIKLGLEKKKKGEGKREKEGWRQKIKMSKNRRREVKRDEGKAEGGRVIIT